METFRKILGAGFLLLLEDIYLQALYILEPKCYDPVRSASKGCFCLIGVVFSSPSSVGA